MKQQHLQEQLEHYTDAYTRTQDAYRQQNGKTADAVLALCKVVYDASVALKDKSFLTRFREENGLTDKGTFSQFRTIGLHHERLSPHAPKLPSSWYTLYQIAKLDENTFTTAVNSDQIGPFITQKEVRQLRGASSPVPRPDYSFKIEVVSDASFDVARARAFHSDLVAFLKEQRKLWSCVDPDVVLSKSLTDALRSAVNLRAA